MKKTLISVTVCIALLIMSIASVMIAPAYAADTVTLSVSDTAGALGDIVEVTIDVSENSYIVNGDFDLFYNTDILKYVEESCEPTALLNDFYVAANEPIPGEVRMSFATAASVGITDAGALFTLQFEIISKDALQTEIQLQASPVCGCNGGDDYTIKPVLQEGVIGIVGGTDPWNYLQEAFIAEGQDHITINADGTWSVTGDFKLSPDFTFDYTDWSHIVQVFTTNTPVKITLVDRDPLGVYGEHAIGLYDNFVGPQYYPAASYAQVDSILGIYNWNIQYNGWKNSGLATVDEVIVDFETDSGVQAVFTSLYMNQSPITTSSSVRTTATTTTTTVQPVEIVRGDLSMDGEVSLRDAQQLFYYINGSQELTNEQKQAADVNADGKISILDAMRLFYYINGQLEML